MQIGTRCVLSNCLILTTICHRQQPDFIAKPSSKKSKIKKNKKPFIIEN